MLVVRRCACAVLGMAATTLLGCHRADAPDPIPPAAAQPGAASPEEPIQLWRLGEQPQAIEALRHLGQKGSSGMFTLEALRMSEREFAALPSAERQRLEQEALALTTDIRELARAARSAYHSSREADQEADALRQGLSLLADELADPEKRLAVIVLVGRAVQEMVQNLR